MTVSTDLRPGTRVRLAGDVIAVTVRDPNGTVVNQVDVDGYYRICLDQPALHHRPDGRIEELPEIVEYYDNLILLEPDH